MYVIIFGDARQKNVHFLTTKQWHKTQPTLCFIVTVAGSTTIALTETTAFSTSHCLRLTFDWFSKKQASNVLKSDIKLHAP